MENISLNEEQIETEIQEKDLNAPRLTPEMLDEVIIDAQLAALSAPAKSCVSRNYSYCAWLATKECV